MRRQRGAQRVEMRFERFERFEERMIVGELAERHAHRVLPEREPHVARRALERGAELGPVHGVAGMDQAFRDRIAREFEELRRGDGLAEEERRGFGQLMRFVEDDGVRGRQQLGHAGVAQHHVGEEQVVIHDHDVRLLRLAARVHHEAFLVMRAFLAETVVARGRDHRPDRRVFRHAREFGLVAGARDLRETDDLLQMRRILAGRQAAAVGGALQVVVTQVVRAPLEHRDRHRHRERVAHGRDVALEKLVLQMLGAGRDDDLAAPQHRRHEIRVGLAGARPCLDDQRVLAAIDRGRRGRDAHLVRALFDARVRRIRRPRFARRTPLRLEHRGLGHRAAGRFHRRCHGARHVDLRRTRAIAVDRPREHALGGEDRIEFGAALVREDERCGGVRRGAAV